MRRGSPSGRGLLPAIGSPIRTPVWTLALALPLAGLWLLLAEPDLDVQWENHPAHFWLVLAVAAVNTTVGFAMSEAARRRGDARLFLVGLAFLVAAGFLGLHALATPGVLLEGKNAGFTIATPVGLVNASVLAFASSLQLDGRFGQAVIRHESLLRGALVLLLAAWGAASLASLPPLDNVLTPEEARGPLRAMALVAVLLYALAALRYRRLHGQTRAPLPLAILTSWILLAEAMVAVAFGRNWHASWWEWHLLMAVAFALVAVTARVEPGVPFASLYLQSTVARTNAAYAEALGQLVEGRARAHEIAERFGLSGDQAELVERAAERIRRFRPYLSPRLAAHVEREPEPAPLGGQEREVSVLFADLEGFTSYAEGRPPTEVIAMLNEYWGIAVPVAVEEEGGVIERFAGDAVMVIFNADGTQLDHAHRAARAALRLQERSTTLAACHPGWPRLRAGVNSGVAVVGHVGAEQQRSFTAIGDTTNVAARLQAAAPPGEVVISGSTRAALGASADVGELPRVEAKGKREPLEAFRLRSLAER
jgi:adenylate cyclase